MIRTGIAQINTTVGDFNGNIGKIGDNIAFAKKNDVDIVVFHELTVCGYPPEDLLHKRHFIENNLKALSSLRKQTRGITAVVGFVDRDSEGNLYNAAAVLNNGKLAGVYRKECLPNYGVFDEKRYFVPGKNNPLFMMGNLKIGINICEDLWPDNGIYQRQAKMGADLLINISSSPYDLGKFEKREKLLARRAKETQCFVVYANLIGGQDEIVFDGGSCAFNPHGRCVALARLFEEDFLVIDIPEPVKKRQGKQCIVLERTIQQQALSVNARITAVPEKTAEIYKALVLGTRDYIEKNGFEKVVIGLSGGIDSALVAQIAVDALGKDRVIGVTMPSQFTSSGTYTDARKIAENFGIECLEVPVKPIFDVYLQNLEKYFKGLPGGKTEENIQARIRGNILMALSNKFGWLVLTTGNKSEMAVGYCTLYGDMSGGFAVIKDVYKTTVYALVRYRNASIGRNLIPQTVIDRAPSAELKENQRDQDSLPPYDVLDQILIEYVEKHNSFSGIVKKIKDEDVVKKVLWLVDHSEYKRRQSPPGVKITPRAFGKDWRFPITNKYKNY
ncbi:MAG: NAD+ synthase [Candidatus Omnitrophota bacterium]